MKGIPAGWQFTVGSLLAFTTGIALFLGIGSVEAAIMYAVAMVLLHGLLVLGSRWKWSLWRVLAIFFVVSLGLGFGVAILMATFAVAH